jgi:hypothetical protein
MNKSTFFTGQPIFSQLIKLIPRHLVYRTAQEFSSDRYCKKFDTFHHLMTMLYSCYQQCTSLREVTTGMQACEGRLQSAGLKNLPARTTLSDANMRREYEVFEKIYHQLYFKYKDFLTDSLNKKLLKDLVIIDSTTISLFKEILENAGRRNVNGKKKGGVKVHMAINSHEDVPFLIQITKASQADVSFLQHIHLPPASVIVMDRGYNNYKKFNEWNKNKVTWVTRCRKTTVFQINKKRIVSDESKKAGVRTDENVTMGFNNKVIQRVSCRLIRYYDKETNKSFEFTTNNKTWSPQKIAAIYKRRWQIELLFKRLKQNMQLQYFLGDNENAIKIQIYCSLIADLLLKVALGGVRRKWAFSTMVAIIRFHLMNYTNLHKFLENPEKCKIVNPVPIINVQYKLPLTG